MRNLVTIFGVFLKSVPIQSSAAAIFVILSFSAPASVLACDQLDKPNIIHIMLDEWGYFEWSKMKHPILETPNIDQLAEEGMMFTQFLAGNNVCASTRSSLMTGQHAGHTPIRSNGPRDIIADSEVTIAEVLKEAGYATGGFGKWGLGDRGTTGVPEKQGFDIFYGYYNQIHAHGYFPEFLIKNSKIIPLDGNTGHYYEGNTFSHTLIYNQSVQFIKENKDKPFYAYLAYTPPHGYWGFDKTDPSWQKYKDEDWGGKNQRGDRDGETYAAMVEMMDRQIGEIMQLLIDLDIDDNTIVVLSGDNGGQDYFKNEKHPHGVLAPNLNPVTGERFRGGKRELYEGGLRIPFAVRWPGKIAFSSSNDHLGYFPDLMPTFAEFAGLNKPATTDGLSIVPTLLGKNKAQEQHEYLYWEDGGSRAIRIKNWKAISHNNGPFELYNLNIDIQEKKNIATQHLEIVTKMKNFATLAHEEPRFGEILDENLLFDTRLSILKGKGIEDNNE
ncbi:MAG: arylsulfatase [Kordiimonadaceae bacterium]|jgi:arylsulfatase A|nr:arylsulfatase [Kordiimonadaceae bacterium]MBT6032069.1 arylsulfatase [Kordiimonadaceae bacterium]